ncbi:MAG: helix-turn-helix domain-containing protein [Gaiellaceae bacterium]
MWALAHPLRLRMFELLSAGPATASQLARRLGESRGSTSYHLRVLARFGAIEEEPSLGTRRERWWRRPEARVVWPTPLDSEARAITDQLMATLFAREAEVRRRFVTGDVGADWRRQAFVGNWVVELTPDEADELGRRLFTLVDELRQRRAPRGAEQALVAVSVLPVLGEAKGGRVRTRPRST